MTTKRPMRTGDVGAWSDSGGRQISRPFTPEALREVLAWGESPEVAPFTHQDIAYWCQRYAAHHRDQDARHRALAAQRAVEVADDVDAQWELYLANSYGLEELRSFDFSGVRLPTEWFTAWAAKLDPSGFEG